MITQWGYSKELGLVAYGENQEEVFLGHSVARQQNISEETAEKIDEEIRRLVHEGYDTAKKILKRKAKDLEALAQGLLEFETLSGDEIRELLAGNPPNRTDDDEGGPQKAKSAVPVTKAPKKDDKGGGEMEPQPQA